VKSKKQKEIWNERRTKERQRLVSDYDIIGLNANLPYEYAREMRK
jgi:hypothetical protein